MKTYSLNNTSWESLALAIGEGWATKLWPVCRDRSGLHNEICEIAPRPIAELRRDSGAGIRDANEAHRASWISARCAELDSMHAAREGVRGEIAHQ